MKQPFIALVIILCEIAFEAPGASASSFTPLEWQRIVEKHSIAAMVGQRKHTTWVRDQNRNFIDDEIEKRFRPGEVVNIVVDLNRCLTAAEIERLLAKFGRVAYVGKLISFVLLDRVRVDDLPTIAAFPEVAMIEWQEPLYQADDVSSRAAQGRSSVTYSPNTAEDMGFTGVGVNIGIIDSGLDDSHEAFTGKFVAGFDARNTTDPGDGSTHPPDLNTHGTHVAGIALGRETPGRICRTANDGSPSNCGGMAPAAGVVVIGACDSSGACSGIYKGLDWLAAHAAQFNVRAANISIGGCSNDDGTSAVSQQVNYLAAVGVAVAVAAPNCGGTPGSQLVGAVAAASFAITVQGTDDRGTVNRSDDTIWAGYSAGPRIDFNLVSPNLQALKPDIAAPATNIMSALAGSANQYVSYTGSSMASPHVAGAAADIIQAFPGIDPGSLKDRLLRSADSSHNTAQFPSVDPIWDKKFGYGLLNVGAALQAGTTDVGFPSCAGPGTGPGKPCTLVSPMPPWANTADIDTASPPQVGVANTITAKVKNFGAVAATVLVNFGVYEFAVGNNQFYHIGTVRVTIAPGAVQNVSVPWTPDAVNHQCVQVTIQFGLDTNYANNVTQRNLQVAPSVYKVRVENPFMVPARFQIKPKSERAAWACRVNEEAFTLDPFEDCPRQIQVTFAAPPGAGPGDRANCEVAVYATPEGGKTQLIGGVTVQTLVPRPCRMIGAVVDAQGRPVADALLTFAGQADSSGAAGFRSISEEHPVSATTDRDGIFSVELAPLLPYMVVVEKGGTGKGKVLVRPTCGTCAMKFLLGSEGVKSVGHCNIRSSFAIPRSSKAFANNLGRQLV